MPGFEFATSNKQGMLEAINASLSITNQGTANYVVGFINPHVYNVASESSEVGAFLAKANILCIDGIGAQIVASVCTRRWLPRVVADQLFNAFLAHPRQPCRAVLIGVESDEVLQAAVNINQRSSGILIADTVDGFQNDAIYEEFLTHHSDIRVVLIGAGSPKSERIAMLANQVCHSTTIIHIGAGTIKTWAGTKKRCPLWLSWIGMEWFHRVIHEPHTRTRYVSGIWHFLGNLATDHSTFENKFNRSTNNISATDQPRNTTGEPH